MKIRLFSDLHLEFEDFTPPAVKADVVVLAGDIHVKSRGIGWALKHFPHTPVVYVLGNHEYYGGQLDRTLEKMRAKAFGTHVHILDKDSLVIDGVRFLGGTLWTDYRLTGNQPLAEWDASQNLEDFKFIRTKLLRRIRPSDVLLKHNETRDWLSTELDTFFEGKTVVVSHHAPSELSIHPKYVQRPGHTNAAYASRLDHLLGDERVAFHFHGHVHNSVDYNLYGTRVVCNPRGYSPKHLNKDFKPDLILDTENVFDTEAA